MTSTKDALIYIPLAHEDTLFKDKEQKLLSDWMQTVPINTLNRQT